RLSHQYLHTLLNSTLFHISYYASTIFLADLHSFPTRRSSDLAEDRAGKRPGGFCTSFPNREQTRVFMTYSGTSSNIATLAHELGHAYHQHVMNDVNGLNQRDRKSTRLNSSHVSSSYAVCCLKKKKAR